MLPVLLAEDELGGLLDVAGDVADEADGTESDVSNITRNV